MKEALLILFSLVGFFISLYIYAVKKRGLALYCIVGKNCDEVIKSRYGKAFGIENTILGMIYYAGIFAYAISILLYGNLFKEVTVYYFVVIASICAAVFSIYLTWVQMFVLKKWCEYCIVSSLCSVLILAVLVV